MLLLKNMLKKYFIIITIIVFSFFAFQANAFTNEEILAKIASLEIELTEWKSLLKANTASFLLEEKSCHTVPLWGWGYCTLDCPCGEGEGDCNSDDVCETGYCAYDVGLQYGQEATVDVCEKKEITQNIISLTNTKEQLITVKGRVLDGLTKQGIKGVQIGSLGTTDKEGKFEIVTNKISDTTFVFNGYLSRSFSICENCKGYSLALILKDTDNATTIFPIPESVIDIGDLTLNRAMNFEVYSDRFVQISLEYKNELAKSLSYNQYHFFPDALPFGKTIKVRLKDRLGNEYIDSFVVSKEGKQTLSFLDGQFIFGLCGNGICEKEDHTCPMDCESCTQDKDCMFGCEEGHCKKGLSIVSPNGKEKLKQESYTYLEWVQSGLDQETFDFELFAYDDSGQLVNDFEYKIATSVRAVVGQYKWQVPQIEEYPYYKIVAYNKMCLGGNETLVSCMKNRYLDKSNDYFSFLLKTYEVQEAGLASIAEATLTLVRSIKELLQR